MSNETSLLDITLPSFGSSIGSATIVEWHAVEGAAVEAGQSIADIETDKAITELEAPQSGVIESILVPAGSEDIDAGTVLARLRVDGPASGAVKGEVAGTVPTIEVPAVEPATTADAAARLAASPYARALARERQVTLDDVAGSGPAGRIVSRDVPPGAQVPEAGTPALAKDRATALADVGHAPGTYTLEAVSRMRRAIARNLLQSVREIPSYSLEVDVDLDHALAFRKTRNESTDDATGISLNDIVVQACARALLDVPAVNSAWTDEGIARFRHANIAIAVATDTGLLTPVVRAADTLSLEEIAALCRDYIQRAQVGRLASEELQGATFTVSNLGMRGIHAFTSIPGTLQGAILSVGAAERRPVVKDEQVVLTTRASITLTCDHRVIDGAVGAHFLERLREHLAAL